MIKLIFLNLWNRRRQYAWLFIELIIVTGLAWYILDRPIVFMHDSNMPLGYDADRLAIIEMAELPAGSKNFITADSTEEAAEANFERSLDLVRQYEGVERVTALGNYGLINSLGISLTSRRTASDDPEKRIPANTVVTFFPGLEFFETYGLQAAPGSPSAEELSKNLQEGDIVITESMARIHWPDGDAVGKSFIYIPQGGDTIFTHIGGVIRDFRYQTHLRTAAIELQPSRSNINYHSFKIIARLDKDVDADSWVKGFRSWAVDHMKAGNLYCKSVMSYKDMISDTEFNSGMTTSIRSAWLMAAFFLINLILGVTGSFYLQTRRRITEMGLHRSFGARKGNILSIIMGEGLMLSVISFLIGDLIYLQYAVKAGLSQGHINNGSLQPVASWVTDFGAHFTVVSGIILAIILVCVAVGTWLPARNISRINIVDALRDE